jgi:hypothetical protein
LIPHDTWVFHPFADDGIVATPSSFTSTMASAKFIYYFKVLEVDSWAGLRYIGDKFLSLTFKCDPLEDVDKIALIRKAFEVLRNASGYYASGQNRA